eukprot:Skav228786  [mRNA]  locus=scaffold589:686714:687381:- [translate_table: standard]
MARAAALCILAAAACLLRSIAFVPAPAARSKEYFDVFYGIDPLAWAFAGFAIVYYGAALKNAATKYNIPVDKSISPKVGGFQGKEIENNEDMEKFYKA